ncbi:unnamed protein product [Cunninghamella blakesleeana]
MVSNMTCRTSYNEIKKNDIIDQYIIQQQLGMGAYAKVYLAQNIESHQKYAIKMLPPCKDAKQRLLQRTEIGLHSRVTSHPNIIQLEKVIRNPTDLSTYMVLEYGVEGDLFSAITERQLYMNQHKMIKHVFLQLIQAVRHCHQLGVYHRDLKSENILVFNGGWTVKLADFGLATTDIISKDYGCGSTFYFSPECQGDLDELRLGYATPANDLWSLGIILINLTTGRNPWHRASIHDPTFRLFMSNPDILLSILPISFQLHSILKRLLCINPHQRMTLDELELAIQQCSTFIRPPTPPPQAALPTPPTTPNRDCFSSFEKMMTSTSSTNDCVLLPSIENNHYIQNISTMV